MQLDKAVAYHKALADATRIRMLILLAGGEMNGQLLAEKLGVTPATVTHHTAKLREASLIHERRDKNTIFFSLDRYSLETAGAAAAQLIVRNAEDNNGGIGMDEDKQERIRASVLKNFFKADGTLKHVPVQLKKKLIVLESLVERLKPGRVYTEKEINAFIRTYHDDFATIRREFIMHQFMFRENDQYERNPREMWARWEAL